YINCWKENTTFKIFYKVCEDLGHKFIQNKKSSELLALIKGSLNKKSAVFIFDEVDKVEDTDFLYAVLEDIYRKSIILITNYRDSYGDMDERIRSRFSPEFLCFRAYNETEITGILKQRRDYAFVQNGWDEEAFKEIVEKCTEVQDLRVGLYLMREAGNIAEERGARKVGLIQVGEAVKKVHDFHIKPKDGLEPEMQQILELIRNNNSQKIGDVYSIYAQQGGEMSYKSFHRRITKLEEGRFISLEKTLTRDGGSTIVNYAGDKKLTEF
ncbi:MAG TPA: hypothetical protein VJI32_07665, partial [Candidatus Nanoarchaeia archaeon]|nr:hypothetical protein [Candidatus Nanoarchaeia archaeon]